ncbi:MAG: hypothetical protein ACKPER_24030 [Dolichospermum sp.]
MFVVKFGYVCDRFLGGLEGAIAVLGFGMCDHFLGFGECDSEALRRNRCFRNVGEVRSLIYKFSIVVKFY